MLAKVWQNFTESGYAVRKYNLRLKIFQKCDSEFLWNVFLAEVGLSCSANLCLEREFRSVHSSRFYCTAAAWTQSLFLSIYPEYTHLLRKGKYHCMATSCLFCVDSPASKEHCIIAKTFFICSSCPHLYFIWFQWQEYFVYWYEIGYLSINVKVE